MMVYTYRDIYRSFLYGLLESLQRFVVPPISRQFYPITKVPWLNKNRTYVRYLPLSEFGASITNLAMTLPGCSGFRRFPAW